MTVMTAKTVREVAVENPAATRIFERFGIDYCCGGNQALEQACQRAGVSLDEVVDSLQMEEETARAAKQVHEWQSEPLSELIAHIRNTHHKYTREETVRLSAFFRRSAPCTAKTILNCLEFVRPSAGCPRNSRRTS